MNIVDIVTITDDFFFSFLINKINTRTNVYIKCPELKGV